jgi:hypothetical protein
MSVELPVFTESRVCQSRKFCWICRQRVKGQAWRENIARIYEFDGECPYGEAWRSETVDGQKPTAAPNLPARSQPQRNTPATLPCVHRGELTETLDRCRTCSGFVSLKVWACQIHGACTLANQGESKLKVCVTCPDRTSPS